MKYKVGDRVRIKSLDWYNENKDKYGSIYAGNGFCFWKNMARLCGEIMKITVVKVDPEDLNKGYYFMENSEDRWTDEMIEGLVEEETKPNIIEEAKTYWDSIKDAWVCPEGYQFKDENGNVINATKIVLEKKKKEYPKTYEECCRIMDIDTGFLLTSYDIDFWKGHLLTSLQKLLICRDAYWKIAGDWKPKFNSDCLTPKYIMTVDNDRLIKSLTSQKQYILAFPTEEMRDAFYENFKELIESCKELL